MPKNYGLMALALCVLLSACGPSIDTAPLDALERSTQSREAYVRELKDSIAQLTEAVKALDTKIQALEARALDTASMTEESRALSKRLISTGQKLNDLEKGPESGISVKVVAGDGDLDAAMLIAQQVHELGFNITGVDSMPLSEQDRSVVYYNSNRKAYATRIADDIGSGMRVKPLSWQSEADIIVVTGSPRKSAR